MEDAILLIQLIEDVVEAQTRPLCLAGMGWVSWVRETWSQSKGTTEAVVGRGANELEMGAGRDERGAS